MARMRIQCGIIHNVPRSSNHVYQPGEQEIVWREKQVNSRIGEWVGPFTVLSMDESRKLVDIQDADISAARPFNVVQVKPFFNPHHTAHYFIINVAEHFRPYSSPIQREDIFMAEVLSPNDPRAHTTEMSEAKRSEIRILLSRGTFKVILKEDIQRNGNVLLGRVVLALKSTIDGNVKHKARFVIGGHRDKLKELMVHSSRTLQPQSVRLLLGLAVACRFEIWTPEVRQAYIQSAITLSPEV